MPTSPAPAFRPLQGVRIVSLAINLPGPATLLRCQRMGATCIKYEPPAGDPMLRYNRAAYAALHQGIETARIDLKTEPGLERLHRMLADTQVLLTAFRPSALAKLGLGWDELRARHPHLSQVAIVSAPGPQADEPGHDITFFAGSGLIRGTELPPTLYADMSGSLIASEAVLQAVLAARAPDARGGIRIEVAMNSAAEWLALPRDWGLTSPTGVVGGGHAGYGVYRCADGRVALAAVEPHFAARLCEAAGLGTAEMEAPATRTALAAWIAGRRRSELEALRQARDLPLKTME